MPYKTILFFLLITLKISAQQKQFSADDNGKFIYYEVVEKAAGKDSLMLRAKAFVQSYNKTLKKQNSTDSSITAKGVMVIDKTILVASHPSGEVSFTLNFEARDKKYRFWLTDFEYIPYGRDRYSNYVPTTKIATPLEKTPGKLSAGEWTDIVEAAYSKTVSFAERLKKELSSYQTEKRQIKGETISTKKW